MEIENSGINLIRVNEICTHTIYQFAGSPLPNGTLYRLVLPLQQQKLTLLPSIATTPTANMPQFYKEVRNRFRTNFTQSGKLIATLEKNQPQEAAFMQKVNTLIKANIENEKFNTSTLCMEMSLSRTQLFRRVKSLMRLAPARHIKTVRLNSAKELLETSDWTVSEIAYKTGFQTISHFTKIFKKQYGIPPSVYRHSTKPATNE
ncbi:MAG: helix-turn-helix domain-containing protein [Bacteroidota bacterium]